ncbi:I78 family peptidase inhibitor [Paracoccus sediminis]|uniref:Peptidase inhibitor I78 family protein n=1 Tax=Paracoccus sediminis TaxID=1214787 RepID=A0A238W1P6_9RHOB|nr:I78 family peptidase inhibitor [Paracoccus sediminis]SNR39629.1 Peptidase inhibitor I78 family protein [Paracoccus sediminis]
MTLRPLLLGLTAIAALAACEPMPVEPLPVEPPDDCRASAYQGLVGQPITVLTAMTFPIGTRQIGPDDAVTSDYRPDRLNIEYGRTARIEKVSCY